MHEELKARLKKADRELGDAVVVVARCAQELSDNAEPFDDLFAVDPEDMVELRNALAHWKKCTQVFLEVVDEVGRVNYEARS